MTRYTDAALLKGEYSHLAAELKAGERSAPSEDEWGKVACDNSAEEAAQEVARHIFSFQQELDPETEQMQILTFCAAGQMQVMAVMPGEGDMLRLDGILLPDQSPVSAVIHASQLSLAFTRIALKDAMEEDDGLTIGYVIFDELKERQKARYDKKKPARAATRKKKQAKK